METILRMGHGRNVEVESNDIWGQSLQPTGTCLSPVHTERCWLLALDDVTFPALSLPNEPGSGTGAWLDFPS